MLLWVCMLFFYGVIALAEICGGFKKTNKKMLVAILLCPMCFLVALRAISIGPDTYAYSRIYEDILKYTSLIDAMKNSRMENGYVFFQYICSRVGFTYFGFQILVDGFIFYSFYRFIYKHSRYVAVSCFWFYTNFFMFGIMNVVRMWLAVAILLYAIDALLNNKIKKFIIIVIVASCFHLSALVFLIAYPLIKVKWDIKRTVLVVSAASFISAFAYQIFKIIFAYIGRYENYLKRFEENAILATILDLIIELVLFCFILIALRRSLFVNKKQHGMVWLIYTFHIIGLCVSIVGLSNNIMGRVAYYFSSYYLLSIPFGISMIRRYQNRLIFSAILILCFCIKFIVIMYYRPEWYQVIPYRFFWQSVF